MDETVSCFQPLAKRAVCLKPQVPTQAYCVERLALLFGDVLQQHLDRLGSECLHAPILGCLCVHGVTGHKSPPDGLEQRRLKEQGRDDLAEKVEWISDTHGDGIGFDILSFDEKDDSERLVEVKTTGLGKYFPFYVSSNEVRCSEACPDQYHLYRVFQFSKSPRIYILRGALSEACRLQPTQFRAVI